MSHALHALSINKFKFSGRILFIFFIAFSCTMLETNINENEEVSLLNPPKMDLVEILEIGMSTDSIKALFPNAEFITEKAWKYGIDGGGVGYLIKENDTEILFYWEHWEKPIVQGIIILDSKIIMPDSIHVGVSYAEYKRFYPSDTIWLDLISNDEYFYNRKFHYQLLFYTHPDNKIAEYNDMSSGDPGFSKLLNPNLKSYAIHLK